MTTKCVESTEEKGGGRMAERREQPTEENISRRRRRRRGTPRRLFAVMGLRALGCLLSCWGHESLRQTLVPPQPVSVAKTASLLYLPPAHTLREEVAASPLLSSPPLSMIPAIQPEMTPAGEKRRMLNGKVMAVYIFVNSKEKKLVDEKQVPLDDNLLQLYGQLETFKYSCNCTNRGYYLEFIDIAKKGWYEKLVSRHDTEEEVRLIVATDISNNVSTVMKKVGVSLGPNVVFGSISLTSKGNRFSNATSSSTKLFGKFVELDESSEAPKFKDDSLCHYMLQNKVQDYIPLAFCIYVPKSNGAIANSDDADTWKRPKIQGFAEHDEKHKRWVFQSFVDVTLSECTKKDKTVIQELCKKDKSISAGLRHSVNKDAEDAKNEKELLSLNNIIDSITIKYGGKKYVRESWSALLRFAAKKLVSGEADASPQHTGYQTIATTADRRGGRGADDKIDLAEVVSSMAPEGQKYLYVDEKIVPDEASCTEVVIEFKQQDSLTVLPIKVDGKEVLAVNPTRVQIVAMDIVKVLTANIRKKVFPANRGKGFSANRGKSFVGNRGKVLTASGKKESIGKKQIGDN
eukprot:GHVS01035352.1.p1 GENE.GHVS01035352.1~~GHVS01035352.1.p1  ORF type:complete len:575 (+),score=86.69 GHVS01035352.1:162-1886(+)